MWVDQLIEDYSGSIQQLEVYRCRLDKIPVNHWTARQQWDRELIAEMINGLTESIEWMRSGHQPGVYRGVDRRGVYNEPFELDEDLFPSLKEVPIKKIYSSEQRRIALTAIKIMSKRERTCYLLHIAEGMSITEIGKELKLSRRTVQQYIDRAKSKAQQAI